jgi:hypothetical protein
VMDEGSCVRRRCHGRAVAELLVCRSCRAQLVADLAALPGLYAECEHALVPRPRPALERTRRRRTIGIPYDEAAATARSGVLDVLAAWSALIADERTVTRPDRREASDLACFLAVHLDWLLAHQAAAEFAEELSAATQAARRAAGARPDQRKRLGDCPEPGCGAGIFATAGEVGCDAGHSWPPHKWLLLSRRLGRQDEGAA